MSETNGQKLIEPSKPDRAFDDWGLKSAPLLERCQTYRIGRNVASIGLNSRHHLELLILAYPAYARIPDPGGYGAMLWVIRSRAAAAKARMLPRRSR
jgi:hypothetical protein